MDSNLWRQVSPYLDEALELDPSAREPWLADLDRARPQIAHALRELLSLDAGVRESGFLERSLVSSDDWLVGKKIGAYTIEHLLGRGGMGSVWLGRRSDEKFEGKAAVKLLDRRGLGPLAVTQIRHEANFLARLSHAHIARLFDAGVRESGQPYLILEYVEGEPIDQYCLTRALPLDGRLSLYLDVLDAVAYAQGQLIVHGDLKPSNVLVTRDGSVKLVDFGVASLRTDAYAAPPESGPAGPKALTPGFAAPEQVRGEPLSAATDVYALGVLLHILVTGRHPFGTIDSTHSADPCRDDRRIPHGLDPSHRCRRQQGACVETSMPSSLEHSIETPRGVTPWRRTWRPTSAASVGHFPVHARRPTRAYAARKFAQRHWGGVLSALLTLIVLISAEAITTLQMLDARHQRDFARRQLARAGVPERAHELCVDRCGARRQAIPRERTARPRRACIGAPAQQRCGASSAEGFAIGRQYDIQDEDNAALKYLGEAYQLSRNVADSSVRARAACAFAGMLAKRDKSARSEALFEAGIEELPDNAEFALDRSFCWMNGHRIAMDHGDTPLSIERTQAAIRALAQVPFDHDLADLRAEADLAEAYRDAGRYREAVATFERLWPRLVAQGRDDTATAGTWLNNWGVAVAQMGNPLEAEKLLRRSMDIHRADASYAALSPMLMTNYAQQLLDLGRLAEAQDYAQNALESAKRAGDEVVINQTLLRLARIYRGQHDLARSLAQLDEVEPRLSSALPPGHYAFVALASERFL